MKIGFIGLGKMGSRMVLKLLEEGHEVVTWTRSESTVSNFIRQLGGSNSEMKKNVVVAQNIKDLVNHLRPPRIVWCMVSAGEATQVVLDELKKYVEKDAIVIDGGNAHYKDTQRRFYEFKKIGVKFFGIGVSGGIIAAREGYPLMVGGDKNAYPQIKPILDSLSAPYGGHEYFGEGGAGHFVKMIHNGIEYGIMQSLGEGFAVLQKGPYPFDLVKIAKLWQKGTLVSGFMLDRAVESLEKDPNLSAITGYIEESGEARWTVEQAREENVEVEIIERSLEFRRRSQTDAAIQGSFAARMIAALRQAFGGHEVKKKSVI